MNRALYLERSDKDPLQFDRRPLSEILDDEIPYGRWACELTMIKRAGYFGWQHFLRMRRKCTS